MSERRLRKGTPRQSTGHFPACFFSSLYFTFRDLLVYNKTRLKNLSRFYQWICKCSHATLLKITYLFNKGTISIETLQEKIYTTFTIVSSRASFVQARLYRLFGNFLWKIKVSCKYSKKGSICFKRHHYSLMGM